MYNFRSQFNRGVLGGMGEVGGGGGGGEGGKQLVVLLQGRFRCRK